MGVSNPCKLYSIYDQVHSRGGIDSEHAAPRDPSDAGEDSTGSHRGCTGGAGKDVGHVAPVCLHTKPAEGIECAQCGDLAEAKSPAECPPSVRRMTRPCNLPHYT